MPIGWKLVKSSLKMSQVAVSNADSVWALDTNGKAYVLLEDRWLLAGNDMYISIAHTRDSVWLIRKDGMVLHRHGVTTNDIVGQYWISVDSPFDFTKVITGPEMELFALKEDGSLFARLGISKESPTGTSWYDTGVKAIDVTVGSFGVFLINMDSSLNFAEIKSYNSTSFIFSVFIRIGGALKRVSAGHGPSLWALGPNDTLVKRVGVEGTLPFGNFWLPQGDQTVSISPGLYTVYRVLADGRVLKKTGKDLYFSCSRTNFNVCCFFSRFIGNVKVC